MEKAAREELHRQIDELVHNDSFTERLGNQLDNLAKLLGEYHGETIAWDAVDHEWRATQDLLSEWKGGKQ